MMNFNLVWILLFVLVKLSTSLSPNNAKLPKDNSEQLQLQNWVMKSLSRLTSLPAAKTSNSELPFDMSNDDDYEEYDYAPEGNEEEYPGGKDRSFPLIPSEPEDADYNDNDQHDTVPLSESTISHPNLVCLEPYQKMESTGNLIDMINKSISHTNGILHPFDYHRFSTNNRFRLHCCIIYDWIKIQNSSWVAKYKNATNVFAFNLYSILFGSNTINRDQVCYLVNAANQQEANCLLNYMKLNPEKFPWLELNDSIYTNLNPKNSITQQPNVPRGTYCHLVKPKVRNAIVWLIVSAVFLLIILLAVIVYHRFKVSIRQFFGRYFNSLDPYLSLPTIRFHKNNTGIELDRL